MSRDPRYQKLLNSRRWWEVKRIVWQRAGGLCEQCKADGIAAGVPGGYVTPGVDCHHIVPVESAHSVQEMERLAYDVNNIKLVCIPCHQRIHRDMRSHDTENIKERRGLAIDRWAEQMQARFTKPKENENKS